MKKIVITGSNGLLGQTLINLFLKSKDKYEVIGFSRGKNRTERTDFKYVSIDITQQEKLLSELYKIKPDVIINTAAITNVDACETQQKECDELNVNAVKYLKDFSEKNDTHLVHISTDFIFDGENGPYKETDIPNPLSYYGKSKLKSEEVLIKSKANYTILRTILVYGEVANMTRNNIVLWVKKSLEQKRTITIVNDQYRMPTYVEELAEVCKLSIDKKVYGVFNISSNKLLSIYKIAQEIAEVFKLDKSYIKPISTKTLNQTAARPPKTGFVLDKTIKELGFYPKSFKEDLLKFKEKLM